MPYGPEPYAFSVGEVRRKKQNWPIFIPARWWIDTREIEPRDMIASLLPQYRWEQYRDWEPLFRDEAPPEEDPFEIDEPAPVPSKRAVDPDFDDSPF